MQVKSRLVIATIFACGIVASGLAAADKPTPSSSSKPEYFVDPKDIVKGTPIGDAKFSFVDATSPEAAPYIKAGFEEINRVGTMLVNQVNQALVSDEIGATVSAMHLKNLELPKPQAGKPQVAGIKRTSLMLRDKSNAPDAADAAALERISKQLMDDQKPDSVIVQKVERVGFPIEWRITRPIATTKSCLVCHGDPATFRPDVKAALDAQFPEDKAVDYSSQEWRGVLRVSLVELKK